MTKHPDGDPRDACASPPRRVRLHALLFASAALGTTFLTVLGGDAVKLPPFQGE